MFFFKFWRQKRKVVCGIERGWTKIDFFPNEESDFAKTDENGRTLELLKAQRGEKFPD
jgi:hypothetical protein